MIAVVVPPATTPASIASSSKACFLFKSEQKLVECVEYAVRNIYSDVKTVEVGDCVVVTLTSGKKKKLKYAKVYRFSSCLLLWVNTFNNPEAVAFSILVGERVRE